MHTAQLDNVHAELVSFLQYSLSTLFNECIEFGGEFGHTISEFVESKVDTGERIYH